VATTDRRNVGYGGGSDPGAPEQGASVTAGSGRRPIVGYAWAAPMTLFGLSIGAVTLLTGGRVERRHGVIEFRDGAAQRLLRLPFLRASAITVGHVIVGRDSRSIASCRGHEHGHVRQTERWGVLFMPAYFVAGVWAQLRGGHWYRDNWFERDADRYCELEWPEQ